MLDRQQQRLAASSPYEPSQLEMIKTTPTILAALSAGAAVVHALPVEDGSKSGDPFAVLDPQNWVNPDDSEEIPRNSIDGSER
jgi:hypothetical protein